MSPNMCASDELNLECTKIYLYRRLAQFGDQ